VAQSRRELAVAGILLVAVTLAAYLPALDAGFIWDDDDYVTRNPVLRSLDGLRRIWLEPTSIPQYYPLVHTTFWIEHALWGLDPFGYHLVNVLLHAASAVLVFAILRRLAIPGALLAALVFALHPVHVESVAWITERKNVLSGFFYLLALLAWVRARPPAPVPEAKRRVPEAKRRVPEPKRRVPEAKRRVPETKRPMPGTKRPVVEAKRPVAAMVFFVCALLSKTVTCTLPVAILLIEWWRRGRVDRRDVARVAPMLVVGAALAAVTIWLERVHVLARGAEWSLSIAERLLVAGRALWFYAAKLLWPVGLTFNYPRWDVDAGALRQVAFPVAALAALATLWLLRRRIGRGPLAAVLFFAVTLSPALGFVDVFPFRYSFVADHFQYLASIGLITLAGATVARRLPRLEKPAAVVLAIVLGVLTWRQSRVYESFESVWRDTLEKNPSSWLALNNLGKLHLERGELEEAAKHLSRAADLAEDAFETHVNLGTIRYAQGDLGGAQRHFEKALALRPDHAVPYNNLAFVLNQRGERLRALELLEKALEIDPDYVDGHLTIADVYARLGRPDDALRHRLRVLELAPERGAPGASSGAGGTGEDPGGD